MSLHYLWDEDKTRKLFKTHLTLFTIGGALATIYTLVLPPSTPYHLYLVLIPVLFVLSCGAYFLTLGQKGVYIRFLLFTLEGQLAAAFFMALTGGFLGIVQFAPYMFLLFAVFELGADATVVLGAFSVLTFLGILFFSLSFGVEQDVLQNFFYYCGSYILIVLIERNIGVELSVQFEAKRKLEQVDDLKNQFITLTSHYLRTPLTELKGLSSQLQNPSLNESVKDLELLTEKLLTIASIEKGEAQITPLPGDLSNVVKNLVGEFQTEAKNHSITLALGSVPAFLHMKFDPIKLKSALGYLIDNAIKYNHPSGRVDVFVEDRGDEAVISVSDTGAGIEKEKLETVFSSFNRGGMDKTLQVSDHTFGLSLYIAKLIIEGHMGKITVESTPGVGSRFTIQLPK